MGDLPEYTTQARDGGWRMSVWVQPGARRDECAGVFEGRLKVKLRAQAQENKANEALLAWLSKILAVPKSRLSVDMGHASRKKTVRILAGSPPDWENVTPAHNRSQPQQGDAGHGPA